MAATDKHTTIEELLEAVFSVSAVLGVYNESQLPLGDVGVRWSPACEGVSPGARKRPLVKTAD
jgi:hypothetical protein